MRCAVGYCSIGDGLEIALASDAFPQEHRRPDIHMCRYWSGWEQAPEARRACSIS